MQKDVKEFVQDCLIYQETKHDTNLPPKLLLPLLILDEIWEDVAMNFIIDLPSSNGYNVIMMIIVGAFQVCSFD